MGLMDGHSLWRAEWGKFKKKHPGFEKRKLYKFDAGPIMDKYGQKADELNKIVGKLVALRRDFEREEDKLKADGAKVWLEQGTLMKNLSAVLDSYQTVVDEMERDPSCVPGIRKDFDKVTEAIAYRKRLHDTSGKQPPFQAFGD